MRLNGARVLVTGGTGKLGRQLVSALHDTGGRVSVLTRAPERASGLWLDLPIDCRYGDLTDPSPLFRTLEGVDVVFHLASHAPPPAAAKPYHLPAHWSVTAEGTRRLVNAAVAVGVGRLVYFSSVKVMGDRAGAAGRPADESTPVRPSCLYGRAKLAAEQAILDAGAARRMQVSVLRLPMVYGLVGQGNLARMIDAVGRGRFPPWPRVENRRSAVHVADVVKAALLVATDNRAAGETYLVTDGFEYSTRWLYEQVCTAMGVPQPGWTVPLWCLRAVARLGSVGEELTGRAMPLTTDLLDKLITDAWYSSRKIREGLSFVPSHRLDAEIPKMVSAYLNRAPAPRSA